MFNFNQLELWSVFPQTENHQSIFLYLFFSVFLTQGDAFCKRVFIFNGFFNEFFSRAINNAINYRQLVLKRMLASLNPDPQLLARS